MFEDDHAVFPELNEDGLIRQLVDWQENGMIEQDGIIVDLLMVVYIGEVEVVLPQK